MFPERRPKRRRIGFELMEPRYCLSTIAFASHDVECCSVFAPPGDRRLETADLDGDGDIDLVAASSSLFLGSIVWYKNVDGRGTFGEQQFIKQELPEASSVHAADLDGDGDLDILSSTSYWSDPPGKVVWYENTDGRGAFGSEKLISMQGAHTVAAADLDGDGDLDVVSASDYYGQGQIAWHENTDGRGSFGDGLVVTSNGSTTVDIADLDGDGDLDILGASYHYTLHSDRNVVWYENTDGHGRFDLSHDITSGVTSVSSVKVADLNGDGDADVLIAFARGPIDWYENSDGRGAFVAQPAAISTQQNDGATGNVADLDGDGDVDILNGSGKWYENTDGQGRFNKVHVIDGERALRSVKSADLDADGDLDVVSLAMPRRGEYFRSEISWYENRDGRGTFNHRQVVSSQADGVSSVSVADLNRDGNLDVLVASHYNGIAWYDIHDGDALVVSRHTITTEQQPASMVHAADLDGDGDADILAYDSDVPFSQPLVAWYENTDGQGTFGARRVISTEVDENEWASVVDVADLDGDGDLDVLATFSSPGMIVWYENTDGHGNFSTRKVIVSAPTTSAVRAADLDGDGDLDLVASLWNPLQHGYVAWYENTDGRANFGTQKVIATEQSSLVDVVDLDGDGDLDLVASLWNPLQQVYVAAWYENTDGRGNFGTQKFIASLPGYAVHVADLDGDGDFDVLYSAESTLDWFENTDGHGTFSTPRTIVRQSAITIATADLDGDGDTDTLTANGGGKIAWYENRLMGDVNDDGIFSSSDLVLVFQSGEYEDLAVGNSGFDEGDWNGDGEFDSSDLVLAFQAGHHIAAVQPPAN